MSKERFFIFTFVPSGMLFQRIVVAEVSDEDNPLAKIPLRIRHAAHTVLVAEHAPNFWKNRSNDADPTVLTVEQLVQWFEELELIRVLAS